MSDQTPASGQEDIRPVSLSQALGERYLAYALSTIMSRSLPDVRDGLKPVHRRLLYAMRLLRLNPEAGFKKCARIVGDVMGRFHPHGDQAIYDAMVRLAQEFAVRYPLVEGQGNFGNIDGDNAAAMRYTEARLTVVAEMLLEGIDENTVDFRPNYDGEDEEPVVLPAAFPNLLANGSSGIAVGMATSIPPHNALELCDALKYLIRHRQCDDAALLEFIKGPDFPTGGVCVETPESIAESYRTGRGSFRLRARWQVEELSRGAYRIVVTEIPYQVQKSKLIEKLADLIAGRKLPALADIRDESTDEVRLVLEPKNRSVDAQALMEHLFRMTDLEIRFSLNMNVLDAAQTPRIMPLKEVLGAFLDHRHDVLLRRSRHRLEKIARRLEILDGLLTAYLNLDEVIAIIRHEDKPRPVLMERFGLSELQAEAILNMRLRHLRKLEEMEIRKEHAALKEEQAALQALLDDEKARWRHIGNEISAWRKKLAKLPDSARKTTFAEALPIDDVPLDVLIEREPITVICSQKGWVRAIKGHVAADAEVRFKDGDGPLFRLHAQTTDKLLILAANGRFYTLGCDKLPGGRGHGEPIRLMIDLPDGDAIVAMKVYKPGGRLLVATEQARGFLVEEDKAVAQTRNGRQVVNAGEDNKPVLCVPAEGDMVAVIGENRKLLVFPAEELPVMTRGRGVILQRYRQGGLSDARLFNRADGLTWTTASGRVYTESDLTPYLGRRGGSGRLAPRGFNRNNRFTA